MVQKTRVIKTRKKGSSESSPYWDWINNSHAVKHKDGTTNDWEPAQANPDRLSSDEGLSFQATEATAEKAELIREAMALLSDQQRRVVEMMAEGRTFAETARLLVMSPSTMRNHLNRARKKIVAYVTQNAE